MKRFSKLTPLIFVIGLAFVSLASQSFVEAIQPKKSSQSNNSNRSHRLKNPTVSPTPTPSVTPTPTPIPTSTPIPNPTKAPNTNTFSSTPSWTQDFTKATNGPIDNSVWNVDLGNNDGWGNDEAETYTNNADNLRIDNGNLVLNAKKTGNQYTSARINTEGKFDFTYGKIDIVAMLPTGQGVWPALWFWPTDTKYSNEIVTKKEQDMAWLNNGEIDLVEGSAWGDNDFSGSAHALGHYPDHNVRTGVVTVKNPSTSYHTYSLQWTPNSLDFLVDNVVFQHVANSGTGFRDWPYDQRYHLIMNIAMGGSMSSGLVSKTMPLGINDRSLPAQLKVQSINYYPLATS